MTHMVIFRSPEGKPGYHQAEGLDAAMRFAEMLRNQEQVTDARIFRMDEVPIEFKTYYRVEMAGSGDMASAAGSGDMASDGEGTRPATEHEVTPGPEVPVEAASDVPVEVEATGEEGKPEPVEAGERGSSRHGLFSRS